MSKRVAEHPDYSRYANEYSKFLETNTWKHPTDKKREEKFYAALLDDLNTPLAVAVLFDIANQTKYMASNANMQDYLVSPEKHFGYLVSLKRCAAMLGLGLEKQLESQKEDKLTEDQQSLVDARAAAKKAKNWAEADAIRAQLAKDGIILEDRPDATTDWRRA